MASLLVLSSTCSNSHLIRRALKHVRHTWDNKADHVVYTLLLGSKLTTLQPPLTQHVLKLVSMVYSASYYERMHNVHFMCGNLGSTSTPPKRINTDTCGKVVLQQILCDSEVCTSGVVLRNSLVHLLSNICSVDVSSEKIEFLSDGATENISCEERLVPTYDNVCLGGTFDGLHQAHRILLTESVLIANQRVLVGLTGDELLVTKKLRELIATGAERRKLLVDFLKKALFPHKQILVEVPVLTEPVGPPAWDPDFQCIALSKETEGALVSINAVRKQKGFAPLAAHVINQGELVPDPESDPDRCENVQISSTNLRTRKLGELLRKPSTMNSHLYQHLVVIGLTGGSCSGKSSVCRWLEEDHKANIIDCDRLGHAAYNEPGSPCWQELVRMFGSSIINASDQSIDRAALGKIVFSDPSVKLAQLNGIMWPHIGMMVRANLESCNTASATSMGPRIVVLDAAVLLEAGWEGMCDEIWVVFVPRELQIKRIMERDGKTMAEAEARLDAQMSNEKRIQKANVVLTTVYERGINRAMVNKAVDLLKRRTASTDPTPKL